MAVDSTARGMAAAALAATSGGTMTNPMTTAGDLVVGGAGGTPTRLAIGSATYVLTVSGGVPSWQPAAGGLTANSTATSGFSVGQYLYSDGSKVQAGSFGTGVATALGNALNGASGLVGYSGTLGAATATTLNKYTLTTPATGATLTIADGKTLTVSNTLTFTGTDSSSVNFDGGGTVLYAGASANLTAGFTTTIDTSLGTVTSGTITPSLTTGQVQSLTNNCTTSWTLAAPVPTAGRAVHLHLVVTNAASNSLVVPTFSGFGFATTNTSAYVGGTSGNGKVFDFYIYAENGGASLVVQGPR